MCDSHLFSPLQNSGMVCQKETIIIIIIITKEPKGSILDLTSLLSVNDITSCSLSVSGSLRCC